MNERRRTHLSSLKSSKLALRRRRSIQNIERMARLLAPLSPHSSPSLIPDDYDLSTFIDERRYFNGSPATEMSYNDAVNKLQFRAGPVFFNERGERIWFDGLDWDVQIGMINSLMRPIKDKEGFYRDMPRGSWSDYEDSMNLLPSLTGIEEDHGSTEAEHDVYGDRLRSVSESQSPVEFATPSIITASTTPNTSTAPSPIWDQRKDSAYEGIKPGPNCQLQPSTTSSTTPLQHLSQPLNALTAPTTPTQSLRPLSNRSNVHEKLTFDDASEYGCIARRTMPWIEKARHRSKYSITPTVSELKARANEVVLSGPGLRRIGNVNETLAKEHPMSWHRGFEPAVSPAKEQRDEVGEHDDEAWELWCLE